MAKIRLVTFYEAPNCWNITNDEDDRDIWVQLSEYVFGYIDHIDSPGDSPIRKMIPGVKGIYFY